MGSIDHILSPLSASWSAWTMLVLLLSAVLAEFMQPGIISQARLSIRVQTERIYKEAPSNTIGQFLLSVFRIGTLSMFIYLCLYEQGMVFKFNVFAAICGITFGVLLLKMLCNIILDYTFVLSQRFMPYYQHYGNYATLTACLLYPVLLVLMHYGQPAINIWALIIIMSLFLLVCIYRMLFTYVRTPMAIIYVALYVVTLEILPAGLLYFLSSQMISYI